MMGDTPVHRARAALCFRWSVAAALLAAALVPDSARAQGTQQQGSSFITKIEIYDGDRRLDDTRLKHAFNGPRCKCGKKFRVVFRVRPNYSTSDQYFLVAGGDNCLDSNNRLDPLCKNDASSLSNPLLKSGLIREVQRDIELMVSATDLMGGKCSGSTATRNIFVYTGNETLSEATKKSFSIDSAAPSTPIKGDDDPRPGEGVATVSFTAGSTTEQNVGYQILCETANGQPALDSPPEARFDSAKVACPGRSNGGDGGVTSLDSGLPDLGVTGLDGGFDGATSADSAASSDGTTSSSSTGASSLDPRFVCSGGLNNDGSITVKGLKNGVTYTFYVVAYDESRNPSNVVNLGTAKPVQVIDLWENYKRSGGKATGGYGCSLAPDSAGGGALLLFAALLFGAFRRRRTREPRRTRRRARRLSRSWLLGSIGLIGIASAGRAEAQTFSIDEKERFESPQYFCAEFKAGPYAPKVDSEFDGGTTPFGDLFGSGTGPMFRGELDWQFWRPFGSLGVGVSFGYFNVSAAPVLDTDGKSPAGSTGGRAGGSTAITVVPLSLLFVYRFDVMADQWNIPIVPYIKAGISYTLWWTKIDGNTSKVDSGGDTLEGKGGNIGWQVNLGAAIRLDALDPQAGRALDSSIGVNHTLLFIEMMHLAADRFGSDTALRVGDTTFLVGLAFEF